MYRVHDAAIGRWWQVDPKAEAMKRLSPFNAMGNNPVIMSDPDGDLPFLALIGIGAATGIFGNGLSNVSQGNNFFDGAGKAAFWGGIGAAASIGIGSVFGATGSFGKELGRAGAHALSTGIQSELQGGSFGQGLLSGGISSGLGSALGGYGAGGQIFGGGLGGGAGSLISGGNFFEGFGQGIAVAAFNHALHSGLSGGPGDPPTEAEKQKMLEFWADELIEGRITPKEYLNVWYLTEEGSWGLVKHVLWEYKTEITLSAIPPLKIVRSGMGYKNIVKILKKNGWTFIRNGKGSHRIWKSPRGNTMPIPDHGSKSISRGIINQINKIDKLK